ncbi:hypothetical protein V7968_17145 [Nocardia vulneris]|uniref:hypothetical protein n=1 Tax=Nocardia vulneris TaxID=1141657 RepID=UPI0030CC84B8
MTSLIGRRVAAVLGGTALTAAVVAGMAGAASAQPVRPAVPAPAPGVPSEPVGPGQVVVCPSIDDPDGQVVITTHEGEDGPWVTIERQGPVDMVPATPIDPLVPGTPPLATAPLAPGTPPLATAPLEEGCVAASVR